MIGPVLPVRAIVLDIEGTTTPMAFVYDVLFPFARAHLTAHLRASAGTQALRDVVSRLSAEHAADVARRESLPPWRDATDGETIASVDAYARWLMDRDRKSPGLKLLQGHIWDVGYKRGQLQGVVFPDVVPAIRRWHEDGIRVAIYSSGSVQAQRLLFASTAEGDMTAFIDAFFDTDVGPKTTPQSYARIVEALGAPAGHVLFVSDVAAELSAARTAGLQVLLCSRPGNTVQRAADTFGTITGFDQIRTS